MNRYIKSLVCSGILISCLAQPFKADAQQSLVNPMQYFAARSKSTTEKSYYANVSLEQAKSYFKRLGMIKYSVAEFSYETVRFRNSSRNIFIMVFPISKNRVYIVMSREQYVDEINARTKNQETAFYFF